MDSEAQADGTSRTAADYRDLADKLRGRVDLFGKTLAGFATVATGAVGLTQLGDLFPEDSDPNWLVAAAVAGLLLAALGALTIAVMLMKAGDAAVVEVDKNGLSTVEQTDVDVIFSAAAQRNGMTTLAALQEKETSLRRASARLPEGAAKTTREARAFEMRAAIDMALARGQVAVVRHRATAAVSGTMAKFCYGFVAVGLVVFALAADASSQDRGDQIATAKACAEARKAGATKDDLAGSGCAEPASGGTGSTGSPSSDGLRASVLRRLGTLLDQCEQSSASEPQTAEGSTAFGRSDCRAIEDAMAALIAISRGD